MKNIKNIDPRELPITVLENLIDEGVLDDNIEECLEIRDIIEEEIREEFSDFVNTSFEIFINNSEI
jgi:hypothetical protein